MIDQNYILTYRSLSGHRCNKSAKRPKEGRKKVKNKLNIKLIFNTVEIDNYKTCVFLKLINRTFRRSKKIISK